MTGFKYKNARMHRSWKLCDRQIKMLRKVVCVKDLELIFKEEVKQ